MARKTDGDRHEQRRSDIAGAVWRLVGRGGLESVSMSTVAREAGISVGRVQYYFRSKDALLMYGLELAQHRMEVRIKERLRGMSGDVDAEDILRAAIDEVVGGDPDTQQAIRVSVAYLPRARGDSRVAEVLFGDDRELFGLAAEVVRAAQHTGRASGALDPEQEARIVWGLANNLGSEVAFGQTSVEDARATIGYYLDRMLGYTAAGDTS